MAAQSNALVAALTSAVKLHPRLSAGLAFELGMMVGVFIKTARGRKGIAGATANLIDTAPLISQAPARRPAKRKAAKRKPAPRAA